MTTEHDILTPKEVAERLRVSERMVQLLAADGEIPAFRVGRYWRFRRDRIEEYTQPTADNGEPGDNAEAAPPTSNMTASGPDIEGGNWEPVDLYESLLGPKYPPKQRR